MSVARADKMRLYCFPYAGGSATAIYTKWRRHLPTWLELHPVEFPGRGRRINEDLLRDMPTLAGTLANELSSELHPSHIFFGHSLGALVAFEVAKALVARGKPAPAMLLVSGADAPTVRDDQRYSNLRSDAEVLTHLRELNGTPPEVLENQDLLALMLPIIKADFEICGNYRYASGRLLECPVHAFGGRLDTTTPESLAAWSEECTGRFSLDLLEGDHFFINSELDRLLSLIVGLAQGLGHGAWQASAGSALRTTEGEFTAA